MPWNDADEIVVANGGEPYVAPTGTALPTNLSSLNAAFVGLGFVSEDGATFTVTPEVTDFNVWQQRQPARRELTAQEIQVAHALVQWNEETIPLAFGGGSVTSPATGVYRYDFPAESDALDERAYVLDWEDGNTKFRLVLPKINVTEAVESTLRRSEMAMLPITVKALAPTAGGSPGYLLSDSASFAAGS